MKYLFAILLPLGYVWGLAYLNRQVLPDKWFTTAWYSMPLTLTEGVGLAAVLFLAAGLFGAWDYIDRDDEF